MDDKQMYLTRSESVQSGGSEDDGKAIGSTNLMDANGEIRLIPVS